MDSKKAIDILKQAILLEKRGYAFYCKVAEQTSDPDIKNIFTVMANEETIHMKFLAEQFANYDKTHEFMKVTLPDLANGAISSLVLTEEIKTKIAVAGFEGAAIAAAIDMEKKAIDIYSGQAVAATDPNEKALYTWLSGWENSHLKILSELDNELKEKIWFDNQFWPF